MDRQGLMQALMGRGGDMNTAAGGVPDQKRQEIAALATQFAELQDSQTFARLMQAIGLGTAAVGAVGASPIVAGIGGGLALGGASADRGFESRKRQSMNQMDEARAPYPETYRSPF